MARSKSHCVIERQAVQGLPNLVWETELTVKPAPGQDGLVQVIIESWFMSKIHRIDLSQQSVDKVIKLLHDARHKAAAKMKGGKKNER